MMGGLPPPPPPSRGRPGVDFHACRAAANLHHTGWLFEIERDPTQVKAAADGAWLLAVPRCVAADTSGCAVASWAASERQVPGQPTPADGDPIKLAELGCTTGRQAASCVQLRDLAYRSGTDAETVRLRSAANAGFVAACTKDGNLFACSKVVSGTAAEDAAVQAALDKQCKQGNKFACGIAAQRTLTDSYRDADKRIAAFKALVDSCSGEAHALCTAVAEPLALGDKRFTSTADPAAGLAIADQRCTAGDADGCRVAARLRGAKGPEALRDATKARNLSDRACVLTNPLAPCAECRQDETLPICRLRIAHREHLSCTAGSGVGACERVAVRFQQGDGVRADIPVAAGYLRRGCDGAEKTACVALDEVCTANPDLPVDVCAQALIHNDLFYEAEYQLGAGGEVDLVDADKNDPSARTPGTVTIGDVASQVPTSIRRGSLDADLVVDVVLDRARQAAIKLVVNELLSAEQKARYRYLRDLLEQGARLLADPSTLRREKFQDLGMTVVRAFVASNLVEGLYPTNTELRKAPIIGATIVAGADVFGARPGKPLDGYMHGFLVDVAYYWLGQTRLFGQPSQMTAQPPLCPWTAGPGLELCTLLAERANAERTIGVDKVLDGLRLAKALHEGGFDDLRRLIEAASRSRTIADLNSTPGLNLNSWQTHLVTGSRTRLDSLRENLASLRTLSRASAYTEAGLDLALLKQAAAGARTAIDSPAIRIALGRQHMEHVLRIIRLIERADREVAADAAAAPAGSLSGGGAPGGLDLPSLVLAKLRKDVTLGLQAWGARDIAELAKKITQMEQTLDGLLPALDRLETSIADLRALLARYPTPDGKRSLDVGIIPLYATGDLVRELRVAQRALTAVDDGLHTIFPGEVQAPVRFARSATVRLVGFLDLMQRVARSSALTSRLGEVVAALRLLGTYRVGVFDAPLYDVLEPVIDSIRTHEPMSLDLLFAVIGKVRIDTLIGSLQGKGNACKHENSVDCWTTKLIHALQESVQRDGNELRVDGGKFAERLAQHGDDFRKRHTWRGYLHLTVGVGALHSDALGDADSERRTVPLISEQVGLGFASPSFGGDRFSFKFGAAASGLLYRAVLDSAESKAVMIHPLFFAIDIGELIEIYASPAMLMLYSPEDGRDGKIRWGASVGVNVPLTAYLERL